MFLSLWDWLSGFDYSACEYRVVKVPEGARGWRYKVQYLKNGNWKTVPNYHDGMKFGDRLFFALPDAYEEIDKMKRKYTEVVVSHGK